MTRTHLLIVIPIAIVLMGFVLPGIARGAAVLIAIPFLILGGLYFTVRGGRPQIERERDGLYLANMLTGVLAGEIVGMLFLQDRPG